MSEDALPGDTNIYLLKNGDDQGWTFRSGKNKNVRFKFITLYKKQKSAGDFFLLIFYFFVFLFLVYANR